MHQTANHAQVCMFFRVFSDFYCFHVSPQPTLTAAHSSQQQQPTTQPIPQPNPAQSLDISPKVTNDSTVPCNTGEDTGATLIRPTSGGATTIICSPLMKTCNTVVIVVDTTTWAYAKWAACWQCFRQFLSQPNGNNVASTITATKGGKIVSCGDTLAWCEEQNSRYDEPPQQTA